jgi:hypothetical protein
MIRPFLLLRTNASPLPLAGEADALDGARRVGALTTHTGILVGTPTPSFPRERGRGRRAAAGTTIFPF